LPSITTHTSWLNQAFLDLKPQHNFRKYNDKEGENDVLETMVFGTKGIVDFDENDDKGS
jgi:hypothetical protein